MTIRLPELPEVETVRDGLARHAVGGRVTGAQVLRDYSVRRQDGGPQGFCDQILEHTLAAAVRRGKYLWFPLLGPDGEQTDHALLAHLGMSGQLLVGAPDRVAHRHLRVRLDLRFTGDSLSDDTDLLLDFVDQRTFGYLAVVDLIPTPDGGPGGLGADRPAIPQQVAHIGRDLLDPALDRDLLIKRIRSRKSGIKRALLDQEISAGIGNIYADEALWRSQLHYNQSCQDLSVAQVGVVLDAARDVMAQALRAGGTSFDALYVNVNGESGYFDRSLDAYGREGEPCNRCGALMVRESFMNRSAFSCPVCQPVP